MKASYQSWIKYKTFASILFQLSVFERMSFKKLVFPRTRLSKPRNRFWKDSLLAAWWKFLLVFLTKYSKIYLITNLLRQQTKFYHSSIFRKYHSRLLWHADIKSMIDWATTPVTKRYSTPKCFYSLAFPSCELNSFHSAY